MPHSWSQHLKPTQREIETEMLQRVQSLWLTLGKGRRRVMFSGVCTELRGGECQAHQWLNSSWRSDLSVMGISASSSHSGEDLDSHILSIHGGGQWSLDSVASYRVEGDQMIHMRGRESDISYEGREILHSIWGGRDVRHSIRGRGIRRGAWHFIWGEGESSS